METKVMAKSSGTAIGLAMERAARQKVAKGEGDPGLTWETITPALAADYLMLNIERNRGVNEQMVARMARDVAEEAWRLNGSSVVFNIHGELVDGQHRLRAVILGGKPIRTIVVRGVPVEAFPTIDQGKKRTGGDTLHMLHGLGKDTAKKASAIAQLLWRDVNGYNLFQGTNSPTNQDLVEVLTAFPEIVTSVTDCPDMRRLIPAAVAGYLHFKFGQVDGELRDRFFEGVATGEGLRKGDPRYHLRETLVSARRAGRSHIRREYAAALAIKAWNAFRDHREVKLLRWARDEDFPDIA